jgi:hypothetical protein
LRTRLINAYVDRVVATANTDRRVCAQLIDVLALASVPASLFTPGVLARVATSRLRSSRSFLRGRQETAPE